MQDEFACLPVGSEVSAKYKGAFCEAKIKKVNRSVKLRVTFKQGLGIHTICDAMVKLAPGQNLVSGLTVDARHPDKQTYHEASITKILDQSLYTVVFDDGDIATLRRNALCMKSGKHFNASESLDNLPLTHPEHFGTPVGRKRGKYEEQEEDNDSSDGEEEIQPSYLGNIGRVVCVEVSDKKQSKAKENWFPGLIVSPNAQEIVKINTKEDYLVRSFKDHRYYTVPKKECKKFHENSGKNSTDSGLVKAVENAISFIEDDVLPPHWDREVLFDMRDESSTEASSEEDDVANSDDEDTESPEEKDHLVAELYKHMDDRGTPINRTPSIGNVDVDLYKLFKVVQKLGGLNRVTSNNQWRQVAKKLGFETNWCVNQVRVCYKRYLLSFEEMYRTLGCTMVNHPRGGNLRVSGGRPLVRGVRSASRIKEEDTSSVSSQDSSSDYSNVKKDKNSKEETKTEVSDEIDLEVKGKVKDNDRAGSGDRDAGDNGDPPRPPASGKGRPGRKSGTGKKAITPTSKSQPPEGDRKVIMDDSLDMETEISDKSDSNRPKTTGKDSSSKKAIKSKRMFTRPRRDSSSSSLAAASELKAKKDGEMPSSSSSSSNNKKRDLSTSSTRRETANSPSSSWSKAKEDLDESQDSGASGPVSAGASKHHNKKKVSSVKKPPIPPPKQDEDEEAAADSEDGESVSSGGGNSNLSQRKSGTKLAKKLARKSATEPSRDIPRKEEDSFTGQQDEEECNSDLDSASPLQKKKKGGKKKLDKKGLRPGLINSSHEQQHLKPNVICKTGDKIKVFWRHGQIYEAKIVKEEHIEGQPWPRFFVHYQGWNSRYDEWISRGRIAENLSWNPSSGDQQQASPGQDSSGSSKQLKKPLNKKLGRPSKNSLSKSRGDDKDNSGKKGGDSDNLLGPDAEPETGEENMDEDAETDLDKEVESVTRRRGRKPKKRGLEDVDLEYDEDYEEADTEDAESVDLDARRGKSSSFKPAGKSGASRPGSETRAATRNVPAGPDPDDEEDEEEEDKMKKVHHRHKDASKKKKMSSLIGGDSSVNKPSSSPVGFSGKSSSTSMQHGGGRAGGRHTPTSTSTSGSSSRTSSPAVGSRSALAAAVQTPNPATTRGRSPSVKQTKPLSPLSGKKALHHSSAGDPSASGGKMSPGGRSVGSPSEKSSAVKRPIVRGSMLKLSDDSGDSDLDEGGQPPRKQGKRDRSGKDKESEGRLTPDDPVRSSARLESRQRSRTPTRQRLAAAPAHIARPETPTRKAAATITTAKIKLDVQEDPYDFTEPDVLESPSKYDTPKKLHASAASSLRAALSDSSPIDIKPTTTVDSIDDSESGDAGSESGSTRGVKSTSSGRGRKRRSDLESATKGNEKSSDGGKTKRPESEDAGRGLDKSATRKADDDGNHRKDADKHFGPEKKSKSQDSGKRGTTDDSKLTGSLSSKSQSGRKSPAQPPTKIASISSVNPSVGSSSASVVSGPGVVLPMSSRYAGVFPHLAASLSKHVAMTSGASKETSGSHNAVAEQAASAEPARPASAGQADKLNDSGSTISGLQKSSRTSSTPSGPTAAEKTAGKKTAEAAGQSPASHPPVAISGSRASAPAVTPPRSFAADTRQSASYRGALEAVANLPSTSDAGRSGAVPTRSKRDGAESQATPAKQDPTTVPDNNTKKPLEKEASQALAAVEKNLPGGSQTPNVPITTNDMINTIVGDVVSKTLKKEEADVDSVKAEPVAVKEEEDFSDVPAAESTHLDTSGVKRESEKDADISTQDSQKKRKKAKVRRGPRNSGLKSREVVSDTESDDSRQSSMSESRPLVIAVDMDTDSDKVESEMSKDDDRNSLVCKETIPGSPNPSTADKSGEIKEEEEEESKPVTGDGDKKERGEKEKPKAANWGRDTEDPTGKSSSNRKKKADEKQSNNVKVEEDEETNNEDEDEFDYEFDDDEDRRSAAGRSGARSTGRRTPTKRSMLSSKQAQRHRRDDSEDSRGTRGASFRVESEDSRLDASDYGQNARSILTNRGRKKKGAGHSVESEFPIASGAAPELDGAGAGAGRGTSPSPQKRKRRARGAASADNASSRGRGSSSKGGASRGGSAFHYQRLQNPAAARTPTRGADTDDSSEAGSSNWQQAGPAYPQPASTSSMTTRTRTEAELHRLDKLDNAELEALAQPRPNTTSKYNFYVKLDPSMDSAQRIALLQHSLTSLKETYANIKSELGALERRRKKLRRKEKERGQKSNQGDTGL